MESRDDNGTNQWKCETLTNGKRNVNGNYPEGNERHRAGKMTVPLRGVSFTLRNYLFHSVVVNVT